jgi:ornithine cyclodeaminase/alanine dehydrogenase-like protein (mu-crystallin family)
VPRPVRVADGSFSALPVWPASRTGGSKLRPMSDVLASVKIIGVEALRAKVDMATAVRTLQAVLADGFDPETDLHRTVAPFRNGQLLMMPADFGGYAGQKLATVAPANPAVGLDRIQAVYVLFDATTLTPVALLDGTELTSLRTPAMAAAMLDLVAVSGASSMVVFGTGPQGIRHVEAVAAVRPLQQVRFVGRDQDKAAQAVAAVAELGLDVAVGTAADAGVADIVVCATSASEPLFSADLIQPRTAVAAIGSHEATVRELPGALMGRSQVIVESDRIARTEAGDVVIAVAEGHLAFEDVVPMFDLVNRKVQVDWSRPRIVKNCGMGWQDLAVAQAALV